MRRILGFLTILAAVSAPAMAQAQSAPDILGTWVSVTGEVGQWSGALDTMAPGTATLEIKEQFGGVFKGVVTYRNAPTGPEFEGAEGVGFNQSEAILGVIDWDGSSITWVDHDDETVHRGRLVNDKTMEVIAFEAGAHAVVNRMILIRQ